VKRSKENIVKTVVMTMNVTGLTHQEFRAILDAMGVEARPEPEHFNPEQNKDRIGASNSATPLTK
jgi:hypothetical protein